MGFFWIQDKPKQFEDEVSYMRQSYIDEKKAIIESQVKNAQSFATYQSTLTDGRLREELKERVEEAYSIALGIYEKYDNKIPDVTIQEYIAEALRNIRFYDGRGYYYVYDLKGICIMHAIQPGLEGTDSIYHFVDAADNYPLRDIIDTVKTKDEGYVNFYFFRPDSTEQEPKLSYNKLFEPYNWVIGTGEYDREIVNEIQTETIRRLREIRYDEEGYLFIYDSSGNNIMHPLLPEMEGNNYYELIDPTGMNIFTSLLEASKQGGGFVSYLWSHPGLGEELPKISYAAYIEEWDWMIGSGLYMHQIDTIIEEKRSYLQEAIKQKILYILIVMSIITGSAALLFQINSQFVKKSIRTFSRFFEQASTDNILINADQVYFKEFQNLSGLANNMLHNLKSAQSELQELYERFDLAIEAALIGLWDINPLTGTAYYSDHWFSILGYNREDFQSSIKTWENLLHPDDYLRAIDMFQNECLSAIPGDERYHSQEFRLRKKDGTYSWILSRGKIMAWNDNKPCRIIGTHMDITDLKLLQEELEQSRTFYQHILDTSPIIFFVKDTNGNYIQVNEAYEKSVGQTRQQVLGKKDTDLFPEKVYAEWRPMEEKVKKAGQSETMEMALRVSGKEQTFLQFFTPVTRSDGETTDYVGWALNITDRKEAEHRLEESEARVQLILNSINTGILIIDPETRKITDVNPVAAKMIGASSNTIIGKRCHLFICPREFRDCPILDHDDTVDNIEGTLLTYDKKQLPILKTVIPIVLGGKKFLLESFVDLSKRKKAEEELKRNMDELEKFNNFTVNREERMIELKQEINRLYSQMGKTERYKIVT